MKRLAVMVLMASALGCGSRLHMADTYGRASRAAFTRQVANPNGASRSPALRGLDAQEASAVVDNYRKQLGRESSSAEHPMVILAPQPAGGYIPAAPPAPAH